MRESNLDRLMYRYVTNQVSERERIKIEAWLNVMKAERAAELEFSKEDEERIFQTITNNLDGVEDVIALYHRQTRLKLFLGNQWVQIAASVLVLVSVSFAIWNVTGVRDPDRATSAGAEKLILNDGTLVWLRDGSKFSYYQKEDGIRHAEFTGEALFEVAKIPNSPFTIACGDITVKVLGTSFNLKTDQESIELKVLTGKVNLSSTKDKTGVDIAPNQKVIYSTAGAVERIPMTTDELPAITANTEYNMQFSNTAMDLVIDRIEKKFDVKVMVVNDDLKRCRITSDFTDNSLESTLIMLTDLLDVTYRIDGKNVELSGKGCK